MNKKKYWLILAILFALILILTCFISDSQPEGQEIEEDPKIEVTELQLSDIGITLEIGQTINPVYQVEPSDADIETVNWESGDVSVASVNKYGIITATGVGKTKITGTLANGAVETYNVVVFEEGKDVPDIKVNGVGMKSVWVANFEGSNNETVCKLLKYEAKPTMEYPQNYMIWMQTKYTWKLIKDERDYHDSRIPPCVGYAVYRDRKTNDVVYCANLTISTFEFDFTTDEASYNSGFSFENTNELNIEILPSIDNINLGDIECK